VAGAGGQKEPKPGSLLHRERGRPRPQPSASRRRHQSLDKFQSINRFEAEIRRPVAGTPTGSDRDGRAPPEKSRKLLISMIIWDNSTAFLGRIGPIRSHRVQVSQTIQPRFGRSRRILRKLLISMIISHKSGQFWPPAESESVRVGQTINNVGVLSLSAAPA